MPAAPVAALGTTPDVVEPVPAWALASALAKSDEVPVPVLEVPVENEAPVDAAADVGELPASDAGSRICC
jgi:hypothetical protein